MKEKIKAEIKTNWNKFGLTDNQIDGLATMLAYSCNEEEKVSDAVKSAEFLMRNMQSDNDKARAMEKAQQELEKKYKGLEDAEKSRAKEKEKPKDEASDFQKMMQMMEKMQSQISTLQSEKLNGNRQAMISEIVKDLPSSVKPLYESRNYSTYTEEEFNNVLAETKRNAENIAKEFASQRAVFKPPFAGGTNNGGSTEDKPSEDRIKNVAAMMGIGSK